MDYLLVLVWFLIFTRNHGGFSLKLTEVRIEQHTVRGNTSVLQCQFDLQGETLYSVKWYKDGNEFYRYLPRDTPPAQIFPLPGVRINVDKSNATQVFLKDLTLSSSGRYRCEISAEAPSFQTVSEHGDMVTVALPKEGPRISGGRPRYQVGEKVRMNCTSGESKPAAQLAWFINGQQANASLLRGPTIKYIGREGLETTTLGLEFVVETHHFKRGDMKIKCLATIATVYWNSNEESVESEKAQRNPAFDVREEIVPREKSRADRVQASTVAAADVVCSSLALIVLLPIISVTIHITNTQSR